MALRPILPSLDEHYQSQKLTGLLLSSVDLNAINTTLQMYRKSANLKPMTSKEDLLAASKVLTVMIQ